MSPRRSDSPFQDSQRRNQSRNQRHRNKPMAGQELPRQARTLVSDDLDVYSNEIDYSERDPG